MTRSLRFLPVVRVAFVLTVVILFHDLSMATGPHVSASDSTDRPLTSHAHPETPRHSIPDAVAATPHASDCAPLLTAMAYPDRGGGDTGTAVASPRLHTGLVPLPERAGPWREPTQPPNARRARLQVYLL